MASKIDFPNEKIMKVSDLDDLKTDLIKIYHSYKSNIKGNKLDITDLNTVLGKIK